MPEQDLKELEQKLDELIDVCTNLEQQNQALQSNASSWREERAKLIEKNELARNKVEAMIGRLKSLDTEQGAN